MLNISNSQHQCGIFLARTKNLKKKGKLKFREKKSLRMLYQLTF